MTTLTVRHRWRPRRWPRSRRALAAAAVAALAFSLTGCFSSSFSYISHTSSGTQMFFKVPTKWSVFSAKQLVEAANGPLSQTQINQIEAGQWETSFSAAPHPSIKAPLTDGSNYPNGIVFAKALDENTRDAFSLASLRSEILGEDPLASSTTSPFNVLSYTEFTRPGGIRGSKLVTDITESNGQTATFGQVVAIDPNTNYVFGIGLACRASCWGPNEGLIDQVLNSWNVKEQGR